MSDLDTLLLKALAASDALRLPIRRWLGRASANRILGLRQLASFGAPLRVGGDAATRKTGERSLADLGDQGLAVVTSHRQTKFPLVALTFRGEARARALAGLPSMGGGLWVLEQVAARSRRVPALMTEQWVAEVELNGGRGWGDSTVQDRADLAELAMNALPAVARGLVVAHSDCHGRAYFAATPAGWDHLDSRSIIPREDQPPADGEAEEAYHAELASKLAWMRDAEPSALGEIGLHPLPASHHGLAAAEYRLIYDALVEACRG